MSKANQVACPTRSSAPPTELGRRTASGFVWNFLQTIVGKATSLVGQLVLAWLLVPEDFGLVGLALTAVAFAGIARDAGVQQILVQRHAHLRRWVNPAFWLSLGVGILSGGIIALSAPVAARVYSEPQLVSLVLLVALSSPLGALATVPSAMAAIQMRFRMLALIGTVCAVLTTALSIAFAYSGLGAFSLVAPTPIVAALRSAWLWLEMKPPLSGQLQIRRWRYLLGDSGVLLASQYCLTIMQNGDYAVLGFFFSTHQVGVYFLAFQLSMQPIILLTASLGSVLFPVLSRLNEDRERQLHAYLRSARLLAVVAIPACALQVLTADRLIYLLFPAHWHESIGVLQILCIGMAFRVVGSTAGNLIQAQRRFSFNLVLNSVYGCTYLIACTAGSFFGSVETAAVGASLFFMILGPIHMYAAIRQSGRSWSDVLYVYYRPFIVTLLAAFPVWLAGTHFPVTGPAAVAVLLGQMVLAVVLYAFWARLLLRHEWRELNALICRLPNAG